MKRNSTLLVQGRDKQLGPLACRDVIFIPLGRSSADDVRSPMVIPNGGDLDSTWVAKPEVHAELQTTRKTDCKTLVANDDNYALAA